jgi:hypothetical protein
VPEFNYEQWWSLHLRVARGESLSTQEEQAYQLGLSHLDGETESVEGDTILYLRTLRSAIGRASNQHATLSARSAELDTKIAALESRYQRLTGQALSWDLHVSA